MDESGRYLSQDVTSPTRQPLTSRRPGDASRQPLDSRPGDVEAGLGLQFPLPPQLPPPPGSSGAAGAGAAGSSLANMLNRKRTLIRPERQRVDPTHRNYHYLQHTQQQNMPVQASTTGNRADAPIEDYDYEDTESQPSQLPYTETYGPESPSTSPLASPTTDLRRGKSLLNRDDPRRISLKNEERPPSHAKLRRSRGGTTKRRHPETIQLTPWVFYCRLITVCFPPTLLRWVGVPGRAQQQAWREKIGLISIIVLLGAIVGFLTFGFTQAVCSEPPFSFSINKITNGYLIIHGRAYDLTLSSHPAAIGVPAKSNVLYPPVNAGGLDASFLFQNVNSKCKGLITAKNGSGILQDSNGNLGWYFPCNLFKPDGSTTVNLTAGPYPGYACHTTATARNAYYGLRVQGEVLFDWNGITNSSRNLMVYSGNVIDLDLLRWLDPSKLNLPAEFNRLRTGDLNQIVRGIDATHFFTRINDKTLGQCLVEIAKVGTVDTNSVGCVASSVVLYVSLVFIIGIVLTKFVMALWFHWFLSWRLGSYTQNAIKNRDRENEIEQWTDDIFRPAPNLPTVKTPALERPKSSFFPNKSRFTPKTLVDERPATAYKPGERRSRYGTPRQGSTSNLLSTPSLYEGSINTQSGYFDESPQPARLSTFMSDEDFEAGPSGFIHESVVPQPPPEFMPFNFPLSHVLTMVTTYNESAAGLRTTFDSIATSEYPNSHKLLFVICDGNIKGAGESKTTPDYVVSMMKDLAIPANEVQAFSYIAIANGYKRHNKAKVYAGFYDYDDSTVAPDKQQRVPMICIAKCGTTREQETDTKPGNRGKRDSQIILMSFLQKVLFDERMTELEFEIFNGIWKITGLSPDIYDLILMVDADTKIFPDSMTFMVAAMVKDDNIMGLCGETKIANKKSSWVSMIQVFEYYISHHLTKAFESVFGGVTCLPGCFSMYRIKAPKGAEGYFVPILANPDVVSRYQENIVDTLHKKNLLLLGEDRYLSTLMLKTFPHRKQIFVPQAVCKTIVPDTFSVLLSQRRRWINSTVHNLMELFLVRDLCGTFCFSMQFVVFIELVGTCVLPAAIGFTVYVVVIAIVRRPIPIIPLCLLALILGMPAVLIVMTAKRWSYVGWMFIYLISLVIWNFILPLYAFWNFDDFSWGDTRRIEGELKGGGHGGDDGEFDSSPIVMKRWAEFERDRRRTQLASHSFDLPQPIPISGGRPTSRPPSSKEPSSVRGYDAGYI